MTVNLWQHPPTGAGSRSRPLAHPAVAIVGYALRGCLPARLWWGVLLPCLAAIVFGWLATLEGGSAEHSFAFTAEAGLFGIVLPLTCLVIGDAVLGADLRAGTFTLTWLSPVPFWMIVVGRWVGGWVVALLTLVPALALAPVVAGLPEAASAMAIAGAAGSAAYVAVFVLLGALVRRSTVWALALVLLGERLLGGVLSAIAQVSPLWEAQQVYAGLAEDAGGWRLLREGTPNGWGAVVRLALIATVALVVATWRVAHLSPAADRD